LRLAETGLLDDLEATTHWGVAPLIRELYPQIRLKPEKILALAGSGQQIITAGGASSWAELALYLIAHYCGQEEAVRISKLFLLGDRSDGQLPFAALTRPKAHTDAVIENCQVWIAENYEIDNPVEGMRKHSGLASRTFKRRFRSATGYLPLEYAQTLRVEEAKHLLETSDMPIDRIGTEVGYEDPASFRRLFKRMTGITPGSYRRRFQNIGRVFTAAK
jgi:transcriptional regulator GlxA family with amidase domain